MKWLIACEAEHKRLSQHRWQTTVEKHAEHSPDEQSDSCQRRWHQWWTHGRQPPSHQKSDASRLGFCRQRLRCLHDPSIGLCRWNATVVEESNVQHQSFFSFQNASCFFCTRSMYWRRRTFRVKVAAATSADSARCNARSRRRTIRFPTRHQAMDTMDPTDGSWNELSARHWDHPINGRFNSHIYRW